MSQLCSIDLAYSNHMFLFTNNTNMHNIVFREIFDFTAVDNPYSQKKKHHFNIWETFAGNNPSNIKSIQEEFGASTTDYYYLPQL